MTKFVIFTTPRTGSTLLIKTLDTHPEIMCAGEIFLYKKDMTHSGIQYPFWRMPYIGNKLNSMFNFPMIWLYLNRFLKRFFSADYKSEKAKGFKLMFYQTRYAPGIINYLRGII